MLRIREGLLSVMFVVVTAVWLNGQIDQAYLPPDRAPASKPEQPAPVVSPHYLPDPIARPVFPLRHGPPISVVPIAFPQMVRAAGVIFAGTVTAIRRSPTAGDAVATVSITFHVNRGLRGVATGTDLTIHQWIGLWTGGQQRYRVGEQVLLFLYPESKLGLTSCVAGALGRFSIDPVGRVLLSPQHLFAFRQNSVLGAKSSVSIWDFAWAVQRAGGGEVIAR